ncbi:hypothetical protein Vadar_034292 [Vaccinium darrowii]|uniref:Uncharacterized protein n=1 Tax=Vaccinium darrowii TaxID=229202 RepID=A0ACB7Z8G4_9ERIC|nr:hypothetical protein Vadar_034292 [Vaccinium darrowii]
MSLQLLHHVHHHHRQFPKPSVLCHFPPSLTTNPRALRMSEQKNKMSSFWRLRWAKQRPSRALTPLRYRRVISASLEPLDLTEDNVKRVLVDARDKFGQIFDVSGRHDSLKGRFWHKRSTVLDRLANYLKQRIPEILEVDIEDEKQLDDSPETFEQPGQDYDQTLIQLAKPQNLPNNLPTVVQLHP